MPPLFVPSLICKTLPAIPVNPICFFCRYFAVGYKVKHYILLFFHLLIRNKLATMFALSPIIISGTAGNMGFMKCLVWFFYKNFVVHCISVFQFNLSCLLSALHKASNRYAKGYPAHRSNFELFRKFSNQWFSQV